MKQQKIFYVTGKEGLILSLLLRLSSCTVYCIMRAARPQDHSWMSQHSPCSGYGLQEIQQGELSGPRKENLGQSMGTTSFPSSITTTQGHCANFPWHKNPTSLTLQHFHLQHFHWGKSELCYWIQAKGSQTQPAISFLVMQIGLSCKRQVFPGSFLPQIYI